MSKSSISLQSKFKYLTKRKRLVGRISSFDDTLPHRLGFYCALVLVARKEDAGREPVKPLGAFAGPAARDFSGLAVPSVVYNAATSQTNHKNEKHNQDSRSHGHIYPDFGI
jgi:hypothetical protein